MTSKNINITIKAIECDVCGGLGGIPANVKPDNPEYHIAGGEGGILCPKCKGSGVMLTHPKDERYEICEEVRRELFYDIVREEMYERNWGYSELAWYSEIHPLTLFELLHKKAPLTPEIAEGLAKAFGTSIEMWVGLYKDTIDKPEVD